MCIALHEVHRALCRRREPLEICLVVSGTCDIKLRGLNFGHLGPGAAVGGELSALRLLQEEASTEANSTPPAARSTSVINHAPPEMTLTLMQPATQQPAALPPAPTAAKVTVVAAAKDEEVLCLCIPYNDLPRLAELEREKQKDDPSSESNLLEALQKGLAKSLSMQVAALDYGAKLLEYASILEVACSAEAAAAAARHEAEEATARERFGIEAAKADLVKQGSKRKWGSMVQKLPAKDHEEYGFSGHEQAHTTELALRAELEKYRAKRHVSVKEHFLIAETLPKCVGSSLVDIKSFAGFEDPQHAMPEE